MTYLFTNQKGVFTAVVQDSIITLMVTALGYLPQEIELSRENNKDLTFELEESESFQEKFSHQIMSRFRTAMDLGFEAFIVISFGLELLFMTHFGVATVLPFVALTGLNAILWFIHLYHKRFF